MLGAYAHGKHTIDRAMVEKAGREVFGKMPTSTPPDGMPGVRSTGLGIVIGAGLAVAALAAFVFFDGWRNGNPAPVVVAGPAPIAASAAASSSASANASAALGAAQASAAASTPARPGGASAAAPTHADSPAAPGHARGTNASARRASSTPAAAPH
jgi:hypothetical protein